jgi:DNA-binding transcriptional regulator YhcF (GntR family)
VPVVTAVTPTSGDKPPGRGAGPVGIDVDQWEDVISFSSRIPLHAQLRDILLDHLHRDGYPLGTRLPTQARLVQRFHLGRTTVRRAVTSLVDDGYVARVAGTDQLILQKRPPVGAASPSRRRPAATP